MSKRAKAKKMKRATIIPANRPVAPKPRPVDMVLPEQRDKGIWAEAQGFDMRDKPVVNLAQDMIGRLGHENKITGRQVDAARQWQELYAGYVAELGTRGFNSCLADSQSGYDASDGNPAAVRAYNAMCNRIGRIKVATLRIECDKGREDRPNDLNVLRAALDAVGG